MRTTWFALAVVSAVVWSLSPISAAAQGDSKFPNYSALRENVRQLWDGKNVAGGAYVVLVPPKSPLMDAAKALAEYRKAEIVSYLPATPEDCLPELIKRKARYAAIFVESKDMDCNLLRKLIVLSTMLDEDPFCDLAFGFVTASSPKQVEEFVKRMIAADRDGVTPFTVMLAASNINQTYGDHSFITGMPGEAHFVCDLEHGKEAISQLGRAGFIHIGSCADPEGVWLFSDRRNLDSTKHWPYDPKLIGQDPKGEMPRLTADCFRKAKLNNAVVWTHACHIGVVARAFVEGDIVSTFGRSDNIEEYWVPQERSVALAIIESGASAYICPVGANFGLQADMEEAFASETGAPLGDVMRHAYHDVVMDTNGHPEQIGLFEKGKPKSWDPDGFINMNSPQHRCLYGDPLFAPFKDKRSPATVSMKADESGNGIRLSFRVESSECLGRTWYGNRGRIEQGRGRIYEEIPLAKDVAQVYIGEIKATTADGKPIQITSQTALIEKRDGKTILHLQLVSPDVDKDGPEDVYGQSVFRKAGATVECFVGFGTKPVVGSETED